MTSAVCCRAVDPAADDAWIAALEEIGPRLNAWAHLRLSGESAGNREDLVQEVLLRAVMHRDRFTGGNFAGWVFQIAKHVLLETLRRRRRDHRLQRADGHSSRLAALHGVPESVTSLTQRIVRRDEFLQLMASVEALDDLDRRLVVLCGIEGEPVRAAAVQVGLGEEACAKRWYRLRQRLRIELGGEQHG